MDTIETAATPDVQVDGSTLGEGFDSLLDSVFSAEQIQASTDTVAAEPPQTPPAQQSEEEQAAAEKPETQQEEAETGEPQPAEDDEAFARAAERAAADGKQDVRVSARGFKDVLYPAYQNWKQVAEFAPTPEVARENFEFSEGFKSLQADYASEDPARIGNVVEWLARGIGDARPEAFAALTTRATEMLQQVSPQAFEEMRNSIIDSAFDPLYRAAAGDPQKLYEVRQRQYDITGRYRKDDPKPQERVSGREQELQRREEALRQQTTQNINGDWQRVTTDLRTGRDKAIAEAIEQELKPIADAYKDYPSQWKAIKTQVASEIQQKMEADQLFRSERDREIGNMRTAIERAWTTRGAGINLTPTVEAIHAKVAARARALAPVVAKDYVNEASARIEAGNKAVHQKRADAQGKRGVNGAGSPVRKSIAPQLPANASVEDKIAALFGA